LKLIAPLPPGKDKTWFISVDALLIKLIANAYLPIALAVPIIVANVKFLIDLKFLNFLKRNLYAQDVIMISTVLLIEKILGVSISLPKVKDVECLLSVKYVTNRTQGLKCVN
jgi:hypothetical protein